MLRRLLLVLAVCGLLAVPAAAQMQNDLLDVFTVQVKPEKGAQFEAVAKKIVAANRQNNGSNWVAVATEYGPGQTIRFISTRANFAAIEKDEEAFMGAMSKAYGKTVAEQIFREADSYMEKSQSEIRRRRWDLSSNAPPDSAALSKLIGASRLVQTIMVRVRPGHGPQFEEEVRAVKAALEKAPTKVTSLVSQAVAGQTGAVYYISTFQKSLGGFDGGTPLPQLLGEEAYEKHLKVVSESVLNSEVTISRFRPELSNPAEEIVAAAPDFWRPKPALAKKGTREETAKAAPNKQP